jgi:hypothetical protein
MRQLYILLTICCLFNLSVCGQNRSDCVSNSTAEEIITIDSNNFYLTRINFDLCYTHANSIVINLEWNFYANGELLNERRVARQEHELILQSVNHKAEDIFNPSVFTVRPAGNQQKLSLLIAPKENTAWKERDVPFTFHFTYRVKNDAKIEEVTFDLSIPEGSTKAEVTQEPAEVVRVVTDTIQIFDTLIVEVIQEKPVAPAEVSSAEIEMAAEDATNEEGKDELKNCIDSVSFYYRRITKIYNQVAGSNGSEAVTSDLQLQYRSCTTQFNRFAGSCSHPQTGTFIREYNRLTPYLNERLLQPGEPVAQNAANADASGGQDEKSGTKVTLDLKDLYLYLITILFVLLLLKYLYPKFKKKRK